MEETKTKILESIISNLADNYNSNDNTIIKDILDDVITNAFFFSKREENEKNLKLLSLEIKQCVKSIYLQRGVEDVASLNESGRSSSYVDALDKMRTDIIKNGKRVIF